MQNAILNKRLYLSYLERLPEDVSDRSRSTGLDTVPMRLSTWFLNDRVTGVGDFLSLGFIWVLVLHEEAVRDKQPEYWKRFNHIASQATHLSEDGTSLSSATVGTPSVHTSSTFSLCIEPEQSNDNIHTVEELQEGSLLRGRNRLMDASGGFISAIQALHA